MLVQVPDQASIDRYDSFNEEDLGQISYMYNVQIMVKTFFLTRALNHLLAMERGLIESGGCLGLETCSSQLEWVSVKF